MEDGAHTIFLSTKGENADEVPQELVCFLEYVGAPLSESDRDYEDEFVRKLQSAVQEVKASREMGARYMTFQELLNDERAQGRAEERATLIKKLSENMTLEDIAHMLEEEVGVIAEIVNTP